MSIAAILATMTADRKMGSFMEISVRGLLGDVFSHMWRERRALVHFGVLPTLLVFAVLAIARLVMGAGADKDATRQVIGILAQLVIFLPITITWYRITVLGDAEAANRARFSFGRPEWRLLGWQAAITAGAFVFMGISGLGTFKLLMMNEANYSAIRAAVIVIWTALWILVTLLVLTRLGMVMVLSAIDRPASLKMSWAMTKGLSGRLLGATVVLVLAGAILGSVVRSMTFLLIVLVAAVTTVENHTIAAYLDDLAATITALVTLLAMATLFGVVYRKLTAQAVEATAG